MYSCVKCLKGNANRAADALSWYPVLCGKPNQTDLADVEAMWASMGSAMACVLENQEDMVVDLCMVEEEA